MMDNLAALNGLTVKATVQVGSSFQEGWLDGRFYILFDDQETSLLFYQYDGLDGQETDVEVIKDKQYWSKLWDYVVEE